jgi:hypothetical protein
MPWPNVRFGWWVQSIDATPSNLVADIARTLERRNKSGGHRAPEANYYLRQIKYFRLVLDHILPGEARQDA